MGILNVTPDSFSGDGIYQDPERAKEQAQKMITAGADIIDIGAESSRPGAKAISPEEEIKRVLPVIKALIKQIDVPISIDTSKADVAEKALSAGASIVNDISGLRFDSKMAAVIADHQAGCVLMHIRGNPENMQQNPVYSRLTEEILDSLKESLAVAEAGGINREKIIIDPGIGFGKTCEHNLGIIKNLRDFNQLDLPILIGTSRKSFIGQVLDLPVEMRLWGTAATVCASILSGAHIVRVHDVCEMSQIARMSDAILNT